MSHEIFIEICLDVTICDHLNQLHQLLQWDQQVHLDQLQDLQQLHQL